MIHMLVDISTLPPNQVLETYWSADMVKSKVSVEKVDVDVAVEAERRSWYVNSKIHVKSPT